ncbi:MAG: RNase III inhibitor [Bacteroidetes bacterium]|nr:RNase III inhibitor [Bacteroidota bacterium]
MRRTVSNVTIESVVGDIAAQPDMEAIVNAANAQLQSGGGVAGAIHKAAGTNLAEECRPMAPIKPGEAVISGAHNLPNKYVIHCLGPVYGADTPEDKLLAKCYRMALLLAEKNNIESVAFPAISTGAFGYPFNEATIIACRTVLRMIPELDAVNLIRFVLFDKSDLAAYEKRLYQYEEID